MKVAILISTSMLKTVVSSEGDIGQYKATSWLQVYFQVSFHTKNDTLQFL